MCSHLVGRVACPLLGIIEHWCGIEVIPHNIGQLIPSTKIEGHSTRHALSRVMMTTRRKIVVYAWTPHPQSRLGEDCSRILTTISMVGKCLESGQLDDSEQGQQKVSPKRERAQSRTPPASRASSLLPFNQRNHSDHLEDSAWHSFLSVLLLPALSQSHPHPSCVERCIAKCEMSPFRFPLKGMVLQFRTVIHAVTMSRISSVISTVFAERQYQDFRPHQLAFVSWYQQKRYVSSWWHYGSTF